MGPFAREEQEQTNREDFEKDKNKILGRFARAGFSFGIAAQIMDMSYEEAIELIGV